MSIRSNYLKFLVLILLSFLGFKRILNIQELGLVSFMGYSSFLWLMVYFLNHYLNKFFLERVMGLDKDVDKKLVLLTALYGGISFVLFFFFGMLVKWIDLFFFVDNWQAYFTELGGYRAVVNFAVFLTIPFSIYSYVVLSRYSKEKEIEEQKVITGNVSAQFESLKNQLDPHFLFNSLNVLEALIEEDPEKATLFNQSLSKTYRYILDQKNKELVPLEEEFAFARTYVDLLKMRFEDSLIFNIPDHVKQEGAKVVPLSLQLLLENVIKHNKASSTSPLYVTINERADGYLEIKNTLNKKTVQEGRKGIGLENIANRYALLTYRPMKVDETTTEFIVKIPILTKIITHMRIIDVPEDEQDLLLQAKKNVDKIKRFYSHLTSFIMVNTFLIVVNLLTYSGFMWSFIPLFAWGIGLASDAMRTFNYSLFLGKDWEEKKIREYLDKHNSEKTNRRWD